MEKNTVGISSMNAELLNKQIQTASLFICAAGLAFSLALANIGWVLFILTVLAEYMFFKKKFKVHLSGLELPLLAGILIYVVSSLTGLRPLYSLFRLPSELFFIIFFGCWYGMDKKMAKSFLYMFALVTALAAFFGLVQYLIGIDIDMQGNLHHLPQWLKGMPNSVLRELTLKQGRIMSSRGHPITYAECAVFGLFFIASFLIIEEDLLKRCLWAAAGIITLGAIIFSYSRGAWLALVVGMPVLLIVKKKKFIRFRYVVLIVAGIGILMFAHPQLRTRAMNLDVGSRRSNSVRIVLWKTGIDIMKDYPVLGIGPRTLKFIYEKYKRPEIPDKRTWSELHNQYLQVAVERGVIGLGIFLWLFFSMLALLYYTWKNHIGEIQGQIAAAGLACFAALIVMCLTENAFFDSEVNLIIWFVLGVTTINSNSKI